MEAKIAAILPDNPLVTPDAYVINRGARDGARQYMHFATYAPPRTVNDPDTGETLDTVERQTGYIYVDEVRERTALCHQIIVMPRGYTINIQVGDTCREVDDPRNEEYLRQVARNKSDRQPASGEE